MLAYRLPTRDPEPSLHRQRSCGNFIQLGVYSESQLASRRWCWGRQSHQPNKACATSGLLLPHRPYSQRPIKSRHILIHLLFHKGGKDSQDDASKAEAKARQVAI
ncbi:Uncharacterized protein HZ326_24633, partial [Fusarium oxysporum f. sp. albedinis]